MKWIKTRYNYLNEEAKLRDVLYKKQKDQVSKEFGEEYLDYEEVDPTDNIEQGKWKLNEEDKLDVLSAFFGSDIRSVLSSFKDISKDFSKVLSKSIDFNHSNLKEDDAVILQKFDINEPTIDQMGSIFNPVFRKLAVNETKGTMIIKKDDNGRPLRDEEGNMIKISKQAGEPVFEKNLVNIIGFIDSYNKCYKDKQVDPDDVRPSELNDIVSLSKENHNSRFKFDFEIFNRDVFLYINHNPKDILNIAISKFFSSCQHLYTGSYNSQLLSNVFDPNSIPAFLTFESKIFWGDDIISDFLPLSRMFIRSIENLEEDENSDVELFFDRSYPDRMKEIFDEMIEKYTNNQNTGIDATEYTYAPDIDDDNNLRSPYMDRLKMKKAKFVGKNTKKLYLNRNYDWEKIKISPNANLEEIVIETEDLPANIEKLNLKPNWIKFKYLSINDFSRFSNMITDSVFFEKCKLNLQDTFELKGVKKLGIRTCEIEDSFDISHFKELDELQILFTLENTAQLKQVLQDIKVKKLVLSSDLFVSKTDKEVLKELKKDYKVELRGPII